MIAVEELRAKFMTRNIAPHGECLVVPGDQFDPDWEFQLEDQGYKIHLAILDSEPVTLVSLTKKTGGDPEKLVFTPPPKPPVVEKHEEIGPGPEHVEKQRYTKRGSNTRWTQEEDSRLLIEWPRARGTIADKARSLVPLFPGRNDHAITCHYDQIIRTSEPSIPAKRGAGGKWSDKDVEKLVTLWNGPMPKSQIEKAFPSRTPKSVRMLIHRLKKAGKIEKRKPGPRAEPKHAEETDVCQDCGLPKDLCACDEEKKEQQRSDKVAIKQPQSGHNVAEVEEAEKQAEVPPLQTVPIEVVGLLREIRDLLTPETIYFQWHCRNCKDLGSAEDSKVWKYCPKCGEELVIWDIQERSE